MRLIALVALLLLAACAQPKYEVVIEEEAAPVTVEPELEVVAEAPAGLSGPDCTPGEDDGIGGTGCQVD